MKGYRVLVLTDHRGHSDQNSLYAILRSMIKHTQCLHLDIASRGLAANADFFDGMHETALQGTRVGADFAFTADGQYMTQGLKPLAVTDYDVLFLRLPRPISDEFLTWISELFDNATIINDPRGIIETSSKQFLLNFPTVCPDTKLCRSIEDVYAEVSKYPIVLKPLREYGGRGLLKIDGDRLDDGASIHKTSDYLPQIEEQLQSDGYLSMRFLKNVSKGDKRILVVDGAIMAASLRLPAADSWLCNVAQGGTSVPAEVTAAERDIIRTINDHLRDHGIFMYGADTLVADDGQRVLSEINSLSIGGWPQAEAQTGQPIIQNMIQKLFQYVDRQQ